MIANAQARVWQSVPATFPSLPNTCFFANPGLQYDDDSLTSKFQQIQTTFRKFAIQAGAGNANF
jgi:hypothetical protein